MEREITPDYVVGLTDGDGCFEIALDLNRLRIRPEFRITACGKDIWILDKIRFFFGFGSVNSYPQINKWEDYGSYAVSGLRHLEKIRNFFKKHHPIIKHKEFENWSKAVDVATSDSLSKRERFLELGRLREELWKMRNTRSYRKYTFEDIKKAASKIT